MIRAWLERIANALGWYSRVHVVMRIAREVSFFEDREQYAVSDQRAPYREAKMHLYEMGMEFKEGRLKP